VTVGATLSSPNYETMLSRGTQGVGRGENKALIFLSIGTMQGVSTTLEKEDMKGEKDLPGEIADRGRRLPETCL